MTALALALTLAAPAPVRVATFDVDATPPLGAAMAYDPVRRLDELTLRCRGVALLGAGEPIVLCAVDWIGVANEGHDLFRETLARAAGTSPGRVAVHALHQHDAPGCDLTAERLVRELGLKGFERFDSGFHRDVMVRAAAALAAALPAAKPATHYGWGAAFVKDVASNRRILGPDGKVRAVRYTATRDPALRAEPEGVIDPEVSVLSFWDGAKPVAALSYYACHPQSYYRTGVPSPDFPGIARFLRGQSVPEALHVHFNGAGGNVGAGKYNDGAKENRLALAGRLADGMRRAFEATERRPLSAAEVGWESVPVQLPLAPHLNKSDLIRDLKTEPARGYVAKADQLAWLVRRKAGLAIDVGCLRVGDARVLHLPGELFVEYQLAAKNWRPDLRVAVAAYGDYGPAYIGTAAAYAEGGYETGPTASNVAPESEAILTNAVRKLLGPGRAGWRPVPFAPDADLRGLSAPGPGVAWVSGTRGTFGRTVDGGATWRTGTVPGAESLDFRDVEAFGPDVAYLLSAGPGDQSRIYRTADGGATWSLQFRNAEPDAFYDALAFWDERHGVAMSDPVAGRFRLLATSDGGATWTPLPDSSRPAARPKEGAFAASGTCLVATGKADLWLVTGGAGAARRLHSPDRGATWEARELPIPAAADSAGAFSVAFRDARHGIVVGGDYRRPDGTGVHAALTDDGGKTWKQAAPSPFRSGAAWAGDRWVAVGTSGSHATADGAAWEPLGGGPLNAVAFTPAGEGWAVGPKGRVVKFHKPTDPGKTP